jgi:hypothetical protein
MFVGIAAERMEVPIAHPEQQESILRFIEAKAAKALRISERPKVEIEFGPNSPSVDCRLSFTVVARK